MLNLTLRTAHSGWCVAWMCSRSHCFWAWLSAIVSPRQEPAGLLDREGSSPWPIASSKPGNPHFFALKYKHLPRANYFSLISTPVCATLSQLLGGYSSGSGSFGGLEGILLHSQLSDMYISAWSLEILHLRSGEENERCCGFSLRVSVEKRKESEETAADKDAWSTFSVLLFHSHDVTHVDKRNLDAFRCLPKSLDYVEDSEGMCSNVLIITS